MNSLMNKLDLPKIKFNPPDVIVKKCEEKKVEDLLRDCQNYVKNKNLSELYLSFRYKEIYTILQNALSEIKKNTLSPKEFRTVKQAVDMYPEAVQLLGGEEGKMRFTENNAYIAAGITILIALLVIAVVLAKQKSEKTTQQNQQKTVGEILAQKKKSKDIYTQKDRDLLELIHELAIIYDNTDRYLNNR